MAEDFVDIRPWIANGRFEGDLELLHNGLPSGLKVQLAVKLTYPGRKREKKYKGESAALLAAQAALASESSKDVLLSKSPSTASLADGEGPASSSSPVVSPKVLAALLANPDHVAAVPSTESGTESGSTRAKADTARPSLAATRSPARPGAAVTSAPQTPGTAEKSPSTAAAAPAAAPAAAGKDKSQPNGHAVATDAVSSQPLFKPEDRARIFETLTEGAKTTATPKPAALPSACPSCQGSTLIAAPVVIPQSPQRPLPKQ
jgi:hypothetical protein